MSNTPGHSEAWQAMVSHETVGCYEDKALASEGPGQIPCTFVEHCSLSALSSQGIGLRIQRAGGFFLFVFFFCLFGFFFAGKADFFFHSRHLLL